MYFLLFGLLLPKNSAAQLEFSQWHWKDSNHIDFRIAPPIFSHKTGTELGTSAINGASSICNRNGDLILTFATRALLDKNNDTIPGTYFLNANTNIDRCFIVPMPCSDSMYLLFALNIVGNNEVLLSGRVYLDASGNPFLPSSLTQIDTLLGSGMDITRHGNNKDYWLLVYDMINENQFKSYLISDTGIASTPVVSTTGPIRPATSTIALYSELVFSPDGSKLVQSLGNNNGTGGTNPETPFRLYGFDNQTGIVTFMTSLEDNTLTKNFNFPAYQFFAYLRFSTQPVSISLVTIHLFSDLPSSLN